LTSVPARRHSQWSIEDLAIFAVYPNRKFLPLKVRSFIDCLVEFIGPEPYWEAGL
jgi:hypothetical protein